MWCVWSYSNTIPFLFFHPVPELQKTSWFLTAVNSQYFFSLFNIITITNSGPYTRTFTKSVLRSKEHSFKLKSRNLKTNGSLEKQICRSTVVSMLWSPSLCQSHCFVVIPERGLAMHVECRERGKKTYVRWMWSVRHAWSHTRTIFQEAFSPQLLYNHTWQERGCQKKEHGPFWSMILRIFFFIECVLACHAWTGRGNLNYCAWLHGRQVPLNVFILLRAFWFFFFFPQKQGNQDLLNVLVLEWANIIKDTLHTFHLFIYFIDLLKVDFKKAYKYTL